ncbi:MAG: transposase [Candidatus Methanomethylicaceae archaeon]
MLNNSDIQETAFKFRCEPVDRRAFKEIFERQSVLAADLCNDLFYETYCEWKAQGFPARWRSLFRRIQKKLRQQYRGKLPDAVLEGCIMRVEAQFANPQKRQKLRQRLELPRFSAKSIPIRSDRGMKFESIPCERRGEILVVRTKLTLLPGRQPTPAVHIRLKDKNSASIMQRILNGYEARRWLENEQERFKVMYQETPPIVSKEILCSDESYPPSSSGAVIYDREGDAFYVSIGYSRPRERVRTLDPTKVMAIDIGIASPFTIAFNFGKQPIKTEELGKMLKDARSEFYKRRRIIQAKFAKAPRHVYRKRLRRLSDAWNGRLQQVMGNTCAYIRQLVEQYQIGRVKIDRPSSREPTFFTIEFRGEKFKIPVLGMVDMLERDLVEMLGEENVESHPFYYSSQICSQCGHWNSGFHWGYREKNNWPNFTCPSCGVTLDDDENAARTMLREDYAQIVERIRQQREGEEEAEMPFDSQDRDEYNRVS